MEHILPTLIADGQNPNWIDFTPDGRIAMVSNTGSNDISLIDASLKEVVSTVPVGKSPKRLAVGAIAAETNQVGSREEK